MDKLLTLARKDLLLLFRNRAALFFAMGWPVLTAVLFGFAFSGGGATGKPRIAVADLDASEGSAAFVAQLRAMPELEVDVQDERTATELVRTGKRAAAVLVPKGYGTSAQRLFYGAPAEVELVVDPARKAEQAMIQGMLQKLAGQRLSAAMSGQGRERWIAQARRDVATMPESDRPTFDTFFDSLDTFLAKQGDVPAATSGGGGSGWQPLAVRMREVEVARAGPRNAFAITFPQGMLWAIVGCIMSFASSLVLERMQGTLVRLHASPLGGASIMLGKSLACFAAIVGACTLLLLLARTMFHVEIASPGLFLLALGCAAFAFTGLMMLIASIGTTVQSVSGAGWAMMMPLMMLGGGMIPLFAMPRWMVAASDYSPVKWAIVALEGAVWRGFSLREMLPPLGVLIG
ncbi:MAG TPA: ABC transporter permease, partial [Xanthomonadales bacterium]|nr:ABC transporter permease [Xanthomonadales bacterium]